MRNLSVALFFCWLLLGAAGARAQGALTIDIPNGNPSALPIAVVPFAFEGAGLPPETDIAQVISADFNRCGQFRALPKKDVVEFPVRGAEVKFPTWRQLKQDFLVIGRVADAEGGALRVEFELYDVAKQERLLGVAVSARSSDLRSAAHQIADMVYEKILHVPGAFWTRMAYVTMTGSGGNLQYALMVADSDGYNPQTVVRSKEPLLSPAWSPDSKKLAYVSFERGNSSIYLQEIATGSRQVLAANKGINGAPAFSPDGNTLALTLSMSGNPEIYLMDLGSRRTTQITKHFSIDTEPTWMPDGQSLLFTSDRAGKPQIYQVPIAGGEPSRISFQGEYNARPTVSYDGKRIAMAQGNGNVYRIAVLDRGTGGSGELRVISPGNLDESPSFAPNGSMLLYATREGAKGVLYAVSTDGRVRQRLVLADGDVREPAWSPLRQH
jgi:TolB protein